ncbi:MAG: hypothetical protein JNN13_11295 [Planctomycetes bacterium]|nr:hypothetical protein [Planctomycetota bacterium]
MLHLRFVSPLLFTAAMLPAQITIADGNMSTTIGAIPATQTAPSFELRADALALNHGFQHGWFYRVAGDSREFALRNLGVVTSGVVVSNDHADVDFADVDSRGLLKVAYDLDVYDSGPASGVVISRVTFMNTTAAPLTVDVFCYTDLDVIGTSGDDVCVGNHNSHRVSDPSGVQIELRAIGNDTSMVGAYPSVRTLLTNSVVDDLAGPLPPFAGDYTGAFQWAARTFQPFEQRTFQVIIAVDTVAAAPPIVENYGHGNGSTFEIHTQTTPLQDNTQVRGLTVQVKGALPFSEYRIGTCLGSWPALPFIGGIDLWIDPSLFIGLYGGLTDANGEASLQFYIPPSPYFAGLAAFHQGLYVDGAAPNGFCYFTPGMMTRVGKL